MSKDDQVRTDDEGTFDPSKRELCSDGMCVGVIGPDGRCKTCGKPGAGGAKRDEGTAAAEPAKQEREPSSDAAPPDDWRPSSVPAGGSAEEKPAADASSAGGHPDWARERVPCPDGMCIGVIAKNGRCGTCGKSADWKESKA
jgi:hypothetical protein